MVRLFSFLSFFKQRSSLSIVKLFFSPKSLFFFPFLWSAVSQNIGEVCTEVLERDASGALGWTISRHGVGLCTGVSPAKGYRGTAELTLLAEKKQMYPILPPGMSASLRVAKTRVKGSPGALLLHFPKVSMAMLS